MSTTSFDVDRCAGEGPQSSLERKFIEEYLREKGYRRGDLPGLPPDEAKRLMQEACMYASLKLAEVESKAHMVRGMHGD